MAALVGLVVGGAACAASEPALVGQGGSGALETTSSGAWGGTAGGAQGGDGAGGQVGAGATAGSGASGGSPWGCCTDCTSEPMGSCSASIECFCSMHGCATPEPWGPNGPVESGYRLEYADCGRRLYVSEACLDGGCPWLCWAVDVMSSAVVGAGFQDDSGACGSDAAFVFAGEGCDTSLPGCTMSDCQPFGGATCPP